MVVIHREVKNVMIDKTNESFLPSVDPSKFQDRRFDQRLAFDNYTYDAVRHILYCSGKPTRLQPQVGEILYILMSAQGEVVSRDDLLTAVWGGRCVSPANIDVRIGSLRQALSDCGKQQRLVKTHRNKGFSFSAPIKRIECRNGSSAFHRYLHPMQLKSPGEKRTVRKLAVFLVRTAMSGLVKIKFHKRSSGGETRQQAQT